MYDLYSPFDIEQHKQNFVDYLEVVVFPDGHIEYAVPSHQEKLIAVCMKELGLTRDELNKRCPKEYYFDFMTWLCNVSHCVSVWNEYVVTSDTVPLTTEQRKTIYKLINAGLLKLDVSANCVGVNPVGYEFE